MTRPIIGYEGRGLGEWLLDLVSDDLDTRERAGGALWAMHSGASSTKPPSAGLPGVPEADAGSPGEELDVATVEAAHRTFAAAVRETVASPGFPAQDFVRGLLRDIIHDDSDRACRKARHRTPPAPEPMARWIVFRALDKALLHDRESLWYMLRSGGPLQPHAAEALERIGPQAAEFTDWLLEQLDADTDEWFNLDRPLAAVARDDPQVVRGLVERLGSRSCKVARGAAWTLEKIGPAARGHAPDVLDMLCNATQGAPLGDSQRPLSHAATLAFASVGRNRPDVLESLLCLLASPCMLHRAAAIDGLRYFTGHADRVVPVLVAALDTFEEYDPDLQYGGDHQRVIRSLAAFGPAAAPAAPRLVGCLTGDEGLNRRAIRLLGSIGPAASPALPALEALADELAADDSDWIDWPWGWELADAIAAIRGHDGSHG